MCPAHLPVLLQSGAFALLLYVHRSIKQASCSSSSTALQLELSLCWEVCILLLLRLLLHVLLHGMAATVGSLGQTGPFAKSAKYQRCLQAS